MFFVRRARLQLPHDPARRAALLLQLDQLQPRRDGGAQASSAAQERWRRSLRQNRRWNSPLVRINLFG